MPSSLNVIKAQHSITEKAFAPIHTELRLEEMVATLSDSHPTKDPFHEQRQQMAQFLQEAELEKEAIITAAKNEAENIREMAEQEGFKVGEKKGMKEGFQAGYRDALQEAASEAATIKQEALNMLDEAAKEITLFYEDHQDEIITLAAQMAEKIVHEKIDVSDERIMVLIHPILSRMVQESKFITLTIAPEMAVFMKERLKELEQTFPLYRFAVLTDANLEKNGCIIENSHVIIDLQVKQQLESMIQELKGT